MCCMDLALSLNIKPYKTIAYQINGLLYNCVDLIYFSPKPQKSKIQAKIPSELWDQFNWKFREGQWKQIQGFQVKEQTGIKIARNMPYIIVFLPTTKIHRIDPITDDLGICQTGINTILRGRANPSYLIGKLLFVKLYIKSTITLSYY